MSYKLPNLFLIGAQKSATTALANTLATHHDIYLPRKKEPFFFCRSNEFEKGLEYYVRTNYSGVVNELWRLDGTVSNMTVDTVPNRIAEMIGKDIRFIAILRHPVSRIQSAFAHHLHMHRSHENSRYLKDIVPHVDEMTKYNLDKLIEWESNATKKAFKNKVVSLPFQFTSWRQYGFPLRYIYISRYSTHIERYFKIFRRNQFLFLTFDDFILNNKKVLDDVAYFLKISPDRYSRYKKSINNYTTVGYNLIYTRYTRILKDILRTYIHPNINKFLLRIEKRIVKKKPVKYTFDSNTYYTLNRLFDDDIKKVEKLTGLNLTSWLSENYSKKDLTYSCKNN